MFIFQKKLELDNIDALFCDANIPEQVLRHAFKLAPDILKCATTVSTAKARRLSQCLGLVDVLFTSKSEAAALLGVSESETSIVSLAEKLAGSLAKSGVISDGNRPLYYWNKDGVGSLRVPCVSGIIDVTGAGDALAASTIAALLKGEIFANAVGAGINAAQKVLKISGAYSTRFA